MKRKKIVVLGMMGRSPFAGQTWLYIGWLRAFAKLGHDVWYVEDDPSWPYDPVRESPTDDGLYAARHIAACMERIGLKDRWAFRMPDLKDHCWGLSPARLDALYGECDALLNIVGATDLRDVHMSAPLRVYVQTDPVTAELRLAEGDLHTLAAFQAHQRIFTYGENYGAPDCQVPLNGLTYLKTRQPVDTDLWPMHFDAKAPYFTTVGNFRQNHSDVVYKGETYYWSKHHEWFKLVDIPQRTEQRFELAMNVERADDRARLESHGWRITSPLTMSLDIFGAYPAYIRGSRGEFTVAKDQNVRLRSGWFSERDVCYLATGKPVITQDTGFSNILPTGKGLFGFSGMEDALEAIRAINADYRSHCEAARRVALDYFEASTVGRKLLTDLGLE